jgi:dipeptidyl aminopeptidase/acylaminoacyl peptidase
VRHRSGAALAATLLVAPAPVAAQAYFGQNHVQYDTFRWRVLETEHFLVYYYPEERAATVDAARMAERAYAKLSRILDHQFREKKPIVLFASRSDFGQNNVTGDLGEATGGVTEALRHRMLLYFTGDYRSFEHVLAHELVHAFQYDIFARGKAGAGLQTLQQYMPPLWFAEGMAEYLSLGPSTPATNLVLRDAALNGRLPSVKQMTDQPQRFFPYRFGHAFWTYIGRRFGDEVIGQIMHAVPSVGVERAFKRELGVSLEELGEEWKEAMQTQHLPQVGTRERVRTFAQPLLTKKKSGGEIFLAPALSSDGKHVAFLSNGSLARGEVFIDLWLGDARTGKRIKRLVKSMTNPDFEELRLLYSQSAFSPDGRHLAFTAQHSGKDVLYVLDVRSRKVARRFQLPLEGVTGPSFSPDGRRIVVSGNTGGVTDLYVVDAQTGALTRLTKDRFGDLQPQWSPDGKRIAFASDRGHNADLELLRVPHWQITVLDLERGTVTVLPRQSGLNINPQWAPDGKAVAYVSDRAGSANLFMYDLEQNEHFQLTDVVGGVTGLTEYSPAISWAHEADKLAFTYFENGTYTMWSVANPRALRKAPYRSPAPTVLASAAPTNRIDSARARPDSAAPKAAPLAAATAVAQAAPQGAAPASNGPPVAATPSDSGPRRNGGGAVAAADPTDSASLRRRSLYRTGGEMRQSDDVTAPAGGSLLRSVSVAQLLDSAEMALPDTAKFRDGLYRVKFHPDYVSRPSIGYAPDSYGRNVFGGTTLVMSDMLGNNRLLFSGEVNGRVSEARLFAAYASLGRRFQHTSGVSQMPYYFLSDDRLVPTGTQGVDIEHQEITMFVARQIFGVAAYPVNRFTRLEVGGGFNNIGRQRWFLHRTVYDRSRADAFGPPDSVRKDPGLTYVDAQLAFVSDNTLFGYTGPIFGRRYRFQVSPVIGSYQWVEYMADYRRYDPIIFNFLTVATRLYANVSVGRDETAFPKYIARPDFVRGYDRQSTLYTPCMGAGANAMNCNAIQLLGSRVLVANAELRFPVIRQFVLGIIPVALPPIDGVVFYDVGAAWSRGQALYGSRPANFDVAQQRFPVRSYGAGFRVNLFNYLLMRWDYAVALDQPGRKKGFWAWSLWPSF